MRFIELKHKHKQYSPTCALPSIWTVLSSCTASGNLSTGQGEKFQVENLNLQQANILQTLHLNTLYTEVAMVMHPWVANTSIQRLPLTFTRGNKENTRWNGKEPRYNRLHKQIEKYSGIRFNRLPEAKREEQWLQVILGDENLFLLISFFEH